MTKTRRQRMVEAEAIANTPTERSAGPLSAVRDFLAGIVTRFLQLPRLVRVLLVALIALSWVAFIFSLVDRIYFDYFFDANTRAVPAYVTAGIGLAIYLFGWYWLVGTVGMKHRLKSRPIAGLYLLLGLFVFSTDVFLIIYGIASQVEAAQ